MPRPFASGLIKALLKRLEDEGVFQYRWEMLTSGGGWGDPHYYRNDPETDGLPVAEYFVTTRKRWDDDLARRAEGAATIPDQAGTTKAEGAGLPVPQVGTMPVDPIHQLREEAAQERAQREVEKQRPELRWQVDGRDYDISDLRYYGERAGNVGSTRGLATQIAGFLGAVREKGWWGRFEALRPNDDPAWTAALDIYSEGERPVPTGQAATGCPVAPRALGWR